MTDAARPLPATLPASALTAADLALLHADLPLWPPDVAWSAERDAEALALDEWGVDVPRFPLALVPDAT